MSANIEIFDQCVGVVFAKLYSDFPVPTELDYCELPLECADEADDYETIEYKREIWEQTISWLEMSGYICIGMQTNMSAMNVVLTAKALEVMKSVPSSLDTNSQSIGEYLVSNLKEGGSSAIKAGVAYALSTGLQFASKQI